MRAKKVSFFDESASEEREPLLSSPKDEKAQTAVTREENSSGGDDAVVELEGLSRLLVRSCKVFTVASCLAVLLGSVSPVQQRCVHPCGVSATTTLSSSLLQTAVNFVRYAFGTHTWARSPV